jgi:hypothetical protein
MHAHARQEVEHTHTADLSTQKNFVIEKLAIIERSIGKLESSIAALSEIAVYKEQIPALIKLQQTIAEVKKKCQFSISSVEAKADKFVQLQQVFADTNELVNKALQEEIQARQTDIKNLFERISNLEKLIKATSMKTEIDIEEKDIKHQEDMIRVATELSIQVEGEKEYVKGLISNPEKVNRLKQPSQPAPANNLMSLSSYDIISPLLANLQSAFDELTNTEPNKINEGKNGLSAFESSVKACHKVVVEIIEDGLKVIASVSNGVSEVVRN